MVCVPCYHKKNRWSSGLQIGQQSIPGMVNDNYVTVQAASDLTGYYIQHIHRLCYAGKLKAIHIGRSWLNGVDSLEWYLNVIVSKKGQGLMLS